MEFWGVEVKSGAPLSVDPGEDMLVHISLAALGEKKDNGNKPVRLYVKSGDQKLLIGTLSHDKLPQLSTEIVFEKRFELSHSWKNGSVFFSGYKDVASCPEDDDMRLTDDDDMRLTEDVDMTEDDDMTDDEQAVAAEPAGESEDDSEDPGDEEVDMDYVEISFKADVRRFLGLPITQDCNNCVCVSVIRQYECYLKMEGLLSEAEALSIKELMDLIPRDLVDLTVKGDGTVSIESALDTLLQHGTVLARDCPYPLKKRCHAKRCRKTPDVRRFIPVMSQMFIRHDLSREAFIREVRDFLHSGGPFAIRVRWYPSYERMQRGDVYDPNWSQRHRYRKKQDDGHCLVAFSLGRKDGKDVLECQDSRGVGWGHGGGFVYIALRAVTSCYRCIGLTV